MQSMAKQLVNQKVPWAKRMRPLEKKHGKDMRDKLSAYHKENESSAERGENFPMKRGGSAKKNTKTGKE